MATNLKGQSGVTAFLLLHGEKIGIAIVGVLALWFVYASYKVPRLSDKFQADNLKNEISQTSSQIKDFTWDKAAAEFPDKVKKAKTIAAKNDLTVKVDDFINRDSNGKPDFAVDRAIVAPMIRRTDPALVNAIDVRATGGSGLFAFIDEEIRKKQQLRLAAEAAQQAAKEAEKAKREAQKQKEAGGPGGRRNTRGFEGPGGSATELMDPDHPKRRMVEGTARPPAFHCKAESGSSGLIGPA